MRRTAVVASLLLAVTAHADTLRVPEQHATIQDGLDAAVAGDVISVAPGTYVENVSFPTDGLTLLSRVRHQATIDGGGSGHVVSLNNHTGTIDGFVVTNSGGGFYVGIFTSQREQTIRNNRVTGNAGHGIRISSGSNAWIEGNEIWPNGTWSAGIDILTGANGTLVNNLIVGNRYGISAAGGTHVIVNNTLAGNAFNLELADAYATIANNLVTGGEWGIYFSGAYDPDLVGYVADHLTIHHNDVWGNVANYFAQLGLNPFISGPFPPMPGTGEIHQDPYFAGAGLFSLLGISPCVDAGDDAAVPAGVVTDLEGHSRFVGTVDIGAYEYFDATSVELPAADRASIALLAPRPNPFRASTSLPFAIAAPGRASLSVHDVEGRRIRVLTDRDLPDGEHAVAWDGRTGDGARVAAGTYFVRLRAAGETRVRKVIHLGGD